MTLIEIDHVRREIMYAERVIDRIATLRVNCLPYSLAQEHETTERLKVLRDREEQLLAS
jgi:hypothetical protein